MFVVRRVPDGDYWDGTGWVAEWEKALHYPPAPENGAERANEVCRVMFEKGTSCVTFYVPDSWRRRR